jgi:hypothetical protein
MVLLRVGYELFFAVILPDYLAGFGVDGVAPPPTVDENDSVRRTPNETHLVQRVRELEQANLMQQRQIQFLYNALVDTRNQLGYPALSTAVPFLGFPAAGDGTGTGENDGTGVDGTGVDGTDAGTGQQPRTRQRRSIEIESPPDPPDVPRRR